MADEAFALSPISARSAEPTDADYDAISEAFLETARGRWFLGEYARRNRNADTAMVLDAVVRIERTIAAQKQSPEDELNHALAAVTAIVASAKAAVEDALGDPAVDQSLGPHRKSARIIREIAWGLRESGADVRICDLLDGQVFAINSACDDLAAFPMREAALRAIDKAGAEIASLAAGGITPVAPAEVVADVDETPPMVSEPSVGATAVSFEPAPEPEPLETPVSEMASHPDAAHIETAEADVAPFAPSPEPVALSVAEIRDETSEAAFEAPEETAACEPPPEPQLEPVEALAAGIFAEAGEPPPRHTILAQVELLPVGPSGPAAELPAPAQISLGASLIANGIIPKPTLRIDPLAPLRRMSQAEKIAFFS